MGQLFTTIRRLVREGRYVVSSHAAERLDERRVVEWQVVDGIDMATLLSERPTSSPHPSIELLEYLTDGTNVKVVWSYLAVLDIAKLVTVHFLD